MYIRVNDWQESNRNFRFRPLAGIKVMYSTPYEACIYAGLRGGLRGGF